MGGTAGTAERDAIFNLDAEVLELSCGLPRRGELLRDGAAPGAAAR